MNKVVLIGNLSKNIELKYLVTGAAVANSSLALNRYYNNQEGQRECETCFIDFTIWGKAAETCAKYLRKGSRICIVGRISQQTWQDNYGNNRSKHIIVADEVEFLETKPKSAAQETHNNGVPNNAPQNTTPQAPQHNTMPQANVESIEIPF